MLLLAPILKLVLMMPFSMTETDIGDAVSNNKINIVNITFKNTLD